MTPDQNVHLFFRKALRFAIWLAREMVRVRRTGGNQHFQQNNVSQGTLPGIENKQIHIP